MEYRWNVLMFCLLSFVPALTGIYLWNVISDTSNDPQAAVYITTYYVVACFMGFRIPNFQWEYMFDIREGRMANFLLRPMSYPAKMFWYEAGGRTWSTLLTLPVFTILALALGDKFKTPADPWTWLLVLLSYLIAFVMSYFLTATLGLITIWQNQPEGFFILYDIASRWLGGVFVPLTLLPAGLGDWLQWLPFAYLYNLPTRIFLGLPAEQIWQGFAVQLIWLALAALLFKWAWARAIRHYEVYEGK